MPEDLRKAAGLPSRVTRMLSPTVSNTTLCHLSSATSTGKVALLARSQDELEATAREIESAHGHKVLPVACDVADEASVEEAADLVVRVTEKAGVHLRHAAEELLLVVRE